MGELLSGLIPSFPYLSLHKSRSKYHNNNHLFLTQGAWSATSSIPWQPAERGANPSLPHLGGIWSWPKLWAGPWLSSTYTVESLATSSIPQEAVKEKGKHYTALLLHIILDPLSPLPPPPLTEKLVIPFELQIYLLHSITCYIISYQTMKNK